MRAFVEENAGHTAGNFRGNRGAPPWCDVAAGVEQSFPAAVVGCFLYNRDFHYRFLVPESEDGSGKTPKHDEQAEEDSQALAPRASRAMMIVNAQRAEIVYGSGCWHRHAFGDP